MKALTVLAAVGLLALASLHRAPSRPGPGPDGTMPEVVVTAAGPQLVLDEVTVRAEQSAAVAESVSNREKVN